MRSDRAEVKSSRSVYEIWQTCPEAVQKSIAVAEVQDQSIRSCRYSGPGSVCLPSFMMDSSSPVIARDAHGNSRMGTRLGELIMENFVPPRPLKRRVDKRAVASMNPSHPSQKVLGSSKRKKLGRLSLPDT